MADLEFNIKASFDEVAKARQELERLRQELKNTTKATDPIVVQDLTDKYDEQRRNVRELTSAMSRYATVTSSDFAKKMQSLTRECYNFELQADASKRKIEKLSSEIAKMESQLRKGGLDAGTTTVLNTNVSESYTLLNDEKKRLDNLSGLGKQARRELQNMQAEYVKYSGSSNATADNVKIMTDAFAGMIEEMKKVPTVGEGATSLFNRLSGDAKGLAVSLVGGLGFEQLASHIFNVRSEFQQLEISFSTMLGSEQKAGALMSQLIDTAAKTPFDMSSITNGAKQLLAYGTAANEVNDILVHLGDISAGLNVPLGDLVYLYGTTMAQGRMYTMDLRQFMGRGIPMAEELGKLMGKTTQEVQDAVSKGQVGADLVKKAIEGMTAEGGKFGGLMEKQSATLQGKWSNIEDSVEQMFNEFGKKSQGIFGTGLDLISTLVENWETVVKVIGSAAVAVGTYKAGLMAAASIQKVQNQATLDGIASTLDDKIQAYKDMAELYHSYTGKDTSDYKNQRLNDLTNAVGNTDLIGNKKAEELVTLKIKEAQTDGIITEQMAQQLQLKRDMLVAQQQSAAKEQMEALEVSKGLDEKMAQFKEMENDYRHLNGKETKDYKASRYTELGNALSDTENIGDEFTEERVSKQIELAKSEGLISEEMAKQLQLKRDLLVEQSKIAEKEQMEYQNAVNAKEFTEEEQRKKKQEEIDIANANKAAAQAKAEADFKQKIAKANENAYGKALLETNALQKKVDLQQESYDKAMDEAREKRILLAQLDEEIKKQQQIVDQKEKQVVADNDGIDVTSLGRYDALYSDSDNSSVAQYEEEQAKLDELMQKRQQASDEFEAANKKRKSIQEELQTTTDRLTEAQEREIEVYCEVGAEADEVEELVQKGIDIEDGKISITEAATAAMQANTTSETTNATATAANTTSKAANTTSTTANTASQTTNTTATNINTTSENVNTGAKERNSFVTSILAAGSKGLALAQNVLTFATNAVTTSLKGLWAAMLANPITSVITLVTTAMSIFSMFGSEEDDAAAKTQDMGNKAAEASNKVRSLFAVLANGKAEDHKDTINELKSAYEEYGIKLDETKMKSENMGDQLDELKAHEEELIGIIEKRSIEMERANQLQEAYNNYNSANDNTYDSFKKATGDDLTNVEMGQIRSLVSQEDIDKLAELKREMSECGGDMKVYNALSAQYSQIQGEVNVKIGTYLEAMGHSREEVGKMIHDINDYTDGIVDNKVALDKQVDSVNKSADAAEGARKATSNLTDAQELQALKNQYAKKTFKELNSDIQETIKLCSKKIGLDIKVNYDDSQLPAWIKSMSNSQLKASMAARKQWLDSHKKGDMANFGGQMKTYEQIANELAMMQARGTNVENKPKKSQKELDKEKKAKEKAAKAAEKARNEAETQAGNRRKAEEDYTKTISSYSEKAEETMTKNRIAAMKDGYEKEIAQIKENSEKEIKAVEDGIDKLVEARKKKDQTLWVNSGKNRKANMWKQEKSDEDYRKEVLAETMKDDKGNEIKGEDGKAMTIGQSVQKQMDAIRDKTSKSIVDASKEQTQALWDYLKEYGDFESQKLAITEEYAKKIKKAQESGNDVEVMRLQSERDKSLNKVDSDSLIDKANMAMVFQDFGVILKEPLKKTVETLQDYVKSEDFKKRPMDEQKAVYEALDKANKGLGNVDGTDMGKIGADVAIYNNALAEQAIRQRELAEATREFVRAEEELNNARISGKDSAISEAQATYDSAKAKFQSAQSGLNEANANVASSQEKVNRGLSSFNNMLNKVSSSISSLKGGGLKTVWDLLGNKTQSKIGAFVSGAASLNKQISKMGENLSNSGTTIDEFSKKLGDGINEVASSIGGNFKIDEIKQKLQENVVSTFESVFGQKDAFKSVQDKIGSLLDNVISGVTTKEDAAKQIGQVTGDIIGSLAKAGESSGNIYGMIIGLILQLLDELADNGLSELVKELLVRIGDAIEGLLKNLFTELIPAIIEGVVSAIGSIGEGLLGMFGIDTSGWFSNEKEIAENRERLISEAEKLTKSIDGLKEELSKQSGAKAISTAKELYETQKQQIENARKQIVNENEYHDAHHSNASYWNENAFEVYDHGSWATVTKLLKEYKQKNANAETVTDSASSYQDLLKLTPEQLDYIRSHDKDQWQAILDVGKYDASDEKWEALADLAGTLDETAETLRESLTQTTFDSLKDNFISTLMDMDSSAKDFSDKFSEYLMQAVVSAQVSNLMEDEMNKFYKDWAARAEAGNGTLSQTDINELKKQWDDLVQQGLAIRDQAADITGYKSSYSQSASSGTFETMSQDTGEELNGRFTAVQIATEGTYQVVQEINQKLSMMLGLSDDEIIADDGVTKIDTPTKNSDATQKTANDNGQSIPDIEEITERLSEGFSGSSQDLLDEINAYRRAFGQHSLEYSSGMSTDELVSYINKFMSTQTGISETSVQPTIASVAKESNDSFLTANISSITANVGNMWLAVDEGRTILAQSLMCLQSIDERQDTWHKPMLQAFSDIHEMKDKMSRL